MNMSIGSMTVVKGSDYSLEPRGSRWDSALRRRSYEGSSIAARDGWLTFTPGPERAAGAWSLTIGSGTGQAAKIVHVYGLIVRGLMGTGIYLDRYAVLDSHGRVLASFPSGVERPGSYDNNEAWFPAGDVERLADSVGMVYEEDQVDSPQEVVDRYSGLYEDAKMARCLAYHDTIFFVPFGLSIMVIPVWYPPAPGDGWGIWLLHLLIFSFGAAFAGFGVLHYPPILRRYRRWMKVKHPERFASGR